MYESPIEVIMQEIPMKIVQARGDAIMAEIRERMHVDIDENELARALAYDRNQYDKGFEDARKAYYKPQYEWIGVDERLPEKHGYYLVTTDGSHNAVIDIAEYGKFFRKPEYEYIWEWNKASRVIAWMPLPEPYGGEGNAATSDKKKKRRTVDITKKANIKCGHCEFWVKGKPYEMHKCTCTNKNSPKYSEDFVWPHCRCKCFEWRKDIIESAKEF